jgi:RHH-type transcriptional regulator, proline utilization regulon repressor / proline dehydrogenase / delta 1-pyrroline-5-carboxylate dehydrogenase
MSDTTSPITRDQRLTGEAVAQVGRWLAESQRLENDMPRSARVRAARLGSVVKHAPTAELMMALTDEVLRISDSKAAALHFADVVGSHRTDLPLIDRALLGTGARFAPRFHRIVMPMVVARLRRETSATIIPADIDALDRHQATRRQQGFVLNVNRLGEAIVGDVEARARRDAVIEMIRRPTTTHVSIKLSAIAANISALDYAATIDRLAATLRPVYRAALDRGVFVNLDMEEYRDLAITVDVFVRLLDEPEFVHLTAGIVLQAYLPDTHAAAERLGLWAVERVARGGARVRIRLVKGANLGMETVDAELHGWAKATYSSKLDVDASWKRLLDTLLGPRFDQALIVGAASHNLFDVAWTLLLREELAERGCADRVRFEMLEGMAEAQAQAVRKTSGNLLMYTPVVERADFVPAIGYLTRRLDENTGAENFLRALIDLKVGSPAFEDQASRFAAAVHRRHTVPTGSFRAGTVEQPATAGLGFANASDSDVTQGATRSALVGAVNAYVPEPIPTLATNADAVDAVLRSARSGSLEWANTPNAMRALHLRKVAAQIERNRPGIVAVIVHEANKVILEADSEVSEAVDFANYYATLADGLDAIPTESRPVGTVVVAPPWNFPYAITMGGVLAALAAGNAVVLKPTPQCPRVAARVAADCWAAGIPRRVLQLLAVPDDQVGKHLITHDLVDGVILTGSIQTARMFLDWKPPLHLLAETSGKNAIVVTATSDIDLAIKDLVKSAFGHAGQKCSAASLAIVEASVYDDPNFRRRLSDAVLTLRCGPSTDPGTDVPPLMEAPSPALQRALDTLDPAEEWLVRPFHYDLEDPRCWTPGVRFGVAEGSWFHRTECFGPVLGVMRADDLRHAIRLQNATPFGLTAGIHTLDDHDVAVWAESVEAGNAYVNRTVTGAIVRRQPFGGWKMSSVGPTAKAGGPSYVNVLRRWPAGSDPEKLAGLHALARSESDLSGLQSETNTLRYRPLANGIVAWCSPGTDPAQVELLRVASDATGTAVTVLAGPEHAEPDVVARLYSQTPDRLRIVGEAGEGLLRAANALGVRTDYAPMSDEPLVEIVRWMREQAVSVTQHRHGRSRPLALR